MPPVFGPVSPSPMRLKSCAGTRGTAVDPSVIANRETSGPSRYSSTTTALSGRARHAAAWAIAAARSSVTTTPLPAARPSSLTTNGAPNWSSAAATSSAVVHTWASAVGTSAWAITALANALEPSSWAACGAGAEAVDPRRTHRVRDAGHERGLRSDDDQVHREVAGERGDGLRIAGVHHVIGADLAQSRVAGRDEQGLDAGIGRQREGQGVLAPAGPEEQDVHGDEATRGRGVARRGPRAAPAVSPRRSGRRR